MSCGDKFCRICYPQNRKVPSPWLQMQRDEALRRFREALRSAIKEQPTGESSES